MDRPFTTGQIARLYDLERQRGAGIHDLVQELIRRLESGGVSPGTAQANGQRRKGKGTKLTDRDPRILSHAKLLFDKGAGREVGLPTFRDYLASIPDLPTFPEDYKTRFPLLALVDPRLTLTTSCRIFGVTLEGDDTTSVPSSDRVVTPTTPYWMSFQDGRIHDNRKPSDCRTEFLSRSDELPLTALEGVSAYTQQHPSILDGHMMDLPGSIRVDNGEHCACLRRWGGGEIRLRWRWDGDPRPGCGSASRGGCIA